MEGRDIAGAGAGANGTGGGGDEVHHDVGSTSSVASTSGQRRRRRSRFGNRVWPAPFLESLAVQVAINATRNSGRLAAASALSNLFQVCSTWRAVSRSDLLWQKLTKAVWNREFRYQNNWNWHQEYVYRHRTASNFIGNRSNHITIPIPNNNNRNNDDDGLICLRLAISDVYLAAGFSNGTVLLFLINNNTRELLSTFYPEQRDDRLGRFPSAVTGIILSNTRLVFASLDGDIRVVVLNPLLTLPRLAHLGDIVRDGSLVDFAGCDRWWVGLYAGAPGRAFHVWNSQIEEIVFIGGTLTDPESLTGWRLLNHITESVGRVRVTSHGIAIASTSHRVLTFNLLDFGVMQEVEFHDALSVRCFDASDELVMMVDGTTGWGNTRNVVTLHDEVSRFRVRIGAQEHDHIGCMNCYGYVMVYVMSGGGVIRVWNGENGVYLWRTRERIGGRITAMVSDERHIVASSSTNIYIWDFGAN